MESYLEHKSIVILYCPYETLVGPLFKLLTHHRYIHTQT